MANISFLPYLLASLIPLVRSTGEYSAVAFKNSFKHNTPMDLDQQNYRELVNNSDVFIDKTLLLKQIFNFEGRSILITFPEKWGKSVNLDMIKTFFEIEVDNRGNRIPEARQLHYKLFRNDEHSLENNTYELKKPLLISKDTDFVRDFLGVYPVIFIKMGGINGTNYDEVIDTIRSRISEAFHQHYYLRNMFDDVMEDENTSSETKELMQSIKEKFDMFLEGKSNTDMLAEGLVYLSQVLHGYFSRSVLLLMDDYDDILRTFLNRNIAQRYQKRIISFYSSFLTNAFVQNKFLEKGILTGKFQILSLFPTMNVTKQYTVSDARLYRYYGFTELEVDVLFKKLIIRYDQREKAYHWYNGYQCGKSMSMKLYNPRSVANFVCTRQIDTYRVPSNADDPFLRSTIRHKQFRNILISLVNGKMYTIHFLRIDQSELVFFRKEFGDFTDNTTVVHRDIKLFLSYLNAIGYITVKRNDSRVESSLQIPNNDIRTEISKKVMDYYKEKHAITSTIIDNVVDQLATLIDSKYIEPGSLTKALQTFFDNFPIYDDISYTDLIKFILNFLAIRLSTSKDHAQYWIHNPPQCTANEPDIIFYTLKRQVIIKVQPFADLFQEREVLEEIKKTYRIVPAFEGIKITRLIAIGVTVDKKVSVYSANQKPPECTEEVQSEEASYSMGTSHSSETSHSMEISR